MVKKINEFKELQKKKGKKGFSMIELIIVLAIMAILVALIGTQLIPYLEKSREKRDMTTLDTCMTAFQSALSDQEITLNANAKLSDSTFDTAFKTAFETYAGIKIGDAKIFKSKYAKNQTANDITFEVTADGVITGAWVSNDNGTHKVVASRTGGASS